MEINSCPYCAFSSFSTVVLDNHVKNEHEAEERGASVQVEPCTCATDVHLDCRDWNCSCVWHPKLQRKTPSTQQTLPSEVQFAPSAFVLRDRERNKQAADRFIAYVNADHDDVIAFNREMGCQIRDHIEHLRKQVPSSTLAAPQNRATCDHCQGLGGRHEIFCSIYLKQQREKQAESKQDTCEGCGNPPHPCMPCSYFTEKPAENKSLTAEQLQVLDELRMYMSAVTPKNPLLMIDEFIEARKK